MLKEKAFNIAKNPKYDGYQRGLASMVYKFFDKKAKGSGIADNKNEQNMQLGKELHKPIIRSFKKKQSTHALKIIFAVLIWVMCN